uniref:C-type lectin domain-containing protein n=1 Tax=Acanthochromis polyacanthus TaxID=80966 RepID=A0A3Q1F628_9TELE
VCVVSPLRFLLLGSTSLTHQQPGLKPRNTAEMNTKIWSALTTSRSWPSWPLWWETDFQTCSWVCTEFGAGHGPKQMTTRKENRPTGTGFVLVSSSMDWASAQLHCRNLHSDLARVRNRAENEHLQKMVNRQRVWIGMTRATWRWSDGSEASFVPWKPLHPTPAGNCGVLDVNNLGMTDRSCMEKHPFFCYSRK